MLAGLAELYVCLTEYIREFIGTDFEELANFYRLQGIEIKFTNNFQIFQCITLAIKKNIEVCLLDILRHANDFRQT